MEEDVLVKKNEERKEETKEETNDNIVVREINNEEYLKLKRGNNKKKAVIVVLIFIIAVMALLLALFFMTSRRDEPKDEPVAQTRFEKVVLTNKNQVVKLGNNSFKVRHDNEDEGLVAGNLYINDKIAKSTDGTTGEDYEVSAAIAYVTNEYMFFILEGQAEYSITYAIDSKGKEIKVKESNYVMDNFRMEDGVILATGYDLIAVLNEEKGYEGDFVIEYNNNTISVTPKNK